MNIQKIIKLAHELQDALPFCCDAIHTKEQYDEAIELMDVLVDDATKNELLIDYLFPIIERYEATATEFTEFNERIASMDMGQTILRILMEHHHLTASDFRNEIGNKNIVTDIANGKKPLTITHIKRLAARFNISPAMFFDRLEDLALAAIVEERKNSPEIEYTIEYTLDELLAGYDDINSENDESVRYAKILAAAVGLFGGNEREALRWLWNPVYGLGGKRPVDMLSNDADTKTVLNVIGRMEHGVFT